MQKLDEDKTTATPTPTGDSDQAGVANFNNVISSNWLSISRIRIEHQWTDSTPSRQDISATNW